MPADRVRVSVAVAVAPHEAFRIFTEEVDQWWRRGPRFRHARGERGLIAIEGRLGGRVFESFEVEGQAEAQVIEIGRVLQWQPAERLVFEWRNAVFAPHERTEVEVQFAPQGSGTLVTVEHRGWAAIRGDHPARHGQPDAEFNRSLARWWGDLASALRLHAAAGG